MFEKWFGISICLLHSAIFSGLNLGFFGLSRLRLEVQADTGNKDAVRILNLRKDAHFLLATLLWGNVASNVLLALIAESVLSGIGAFVFSTFGITFFGEIFPQAYLSRHILKTSYVLVPVVKFYQLILYPLAKPTAKLLDAWLGKEKIGYFKEEEIIQMLQRHGHAYDTDMEHIEAKGAINFLVLDDIKIEHEGEVLNPNSIIKLSYDKNNKLEFPDFDKDPEDPFLQQIQSSNEKWVILINPQNEPEMVLDADQFLRDAVYEKAFPRITRYCHRPIIVKRSGATLGDVIHKFKVFAEHAEDDVVDHDIVLFWGMEKRIITGADILGRLLRGIVKNIPVKK
ncbi:MAG: DUF21 domain-containing protein [Candidatus Omnitrophica bacterium]|nr:DUF21 domain-containing protein [Candidatus Omnitrophota bacterium]